VHVSCVLVVIVIVTSLLGEELMVYSAVEMENVFVTNVNVRYVLFTLGIAKCSLCVCVCV